MQDHDFGSLWWFRRAFVTAATEEVFTCTLRAYSIRMYYVCVYTGVYVRTYIRTYTSTPFLRLYCKTW